MIETERLKLIPFEIRHFEAFERGESELAELLKVDVAEGWLVFPEVMPYSHTYLKQNADAANWWMYLLVHKRDGKLVGSGGFKDKPDADGMAEIGYAIAPSYQNKGLATEAAKGLTEFAFSYPQVTVVQAHTLAEENASNRVLRKVGMSFVKALHDAEDGDIWQWRLTREEFQNLDTEND
ncbi:MAG: GNAT family N-acetyltransferase [Acidobacteria bacterium]|nr:GNAT family N-acetyltransferase [Acidobacteriota bacterium]MCA1637497.1 GNAT family N-acetyltransferase [Acidobacteriota bacterium]